MLRVAVPPATIVSSTDSLLDASASSHLVMASPAFAEDYSLDDPASNPVLAVVSLETPKIDKGALGKLTASTVCDAVTTGLSGRDAGTPKLLSKSSESLSATALTALDNTVLPIKNQLSFRKVYMVVALLTLVRTFNLGFLPVDSFSRSFPFFPLDYAASHATSIAVDVSNSPFIALALHSSVYSVQTWVRKRRKDRPMAGSCTIRWTPFLGPQRALSSQMPFFNLPHIVFYRSHASNGWPVHTSPLKRSNTCVCRPKRTVNLTSPFALFSLGFFLSRGVHKLHQRCCFNVL